MTIRNAVQHESYKTIVIDPPWPGPGGAPTFKRGGAKHWGVLPYSTMTGIQLAALKLEQLAHAESQLWLWATNRNIGDAFLLIQLWGYRYRGLFVWLKPVLGMGRHMRSQCEFLLWASRKGARLVEPKECPRQIQQWPNPRAHSEKPAEAYEFIRGLSDPPRCDMFARQARAGFDAWGNEAPENG